MLEVLGKDFNVGTEGKLVWLPMAMLKDLPSYHQIYHFNIPVGTKMVRPISQKNNVDNLEEISNIGKEDKMPWPVLARPFAFPPNTQFHLNTPLGLNKIRPTSQQTNIQAWKFWCLEGRKSAMVDIAHDIFPPHQPPNFTFTLPFGLNKWGPHPNKTMLQEIFGIEKERRMPWPVLIMPCDALPQ